MQVEVVHHIYAPSPAFGGHSLSCSQVASSARLLRERTRVDKKRGTEGTALQADFQT